jgi:hypothetical protein
MIQKTAPTATWRRRPVIFAVGALLVLDASWVYAADDGSKDKSSGSGMSPFGNSSNALPPGDPCRLLSNGDVHRVFSKTSDVTGKFDHSVEALGIVKCVWDYPSGVVSVIVSLDATSGGSKDAAQMLADPFAMNPNKNIRYEVITGIGDEATAVAEVANPSKDIKRDLAVIATQRGKQQIIIVSTDTPTSDRTGSLKALQDLARIAISHL